MGSWRFVLSRRWALFAVAVALAAWACWWLGNWQFGRLHSTKTDNAIIRTNEHRSPAPIEQVLGTHGDVGHDDQWRVITATGTYDASQTVIVRYQNNGDDGGVDVVVPLVLSNGSAVLVDRGFLKTDDTTGEGLRPPAPPGGRVTITGYLRQNGTGSSTGVDNHSTRSISSDTIGPVIGKQVYGGFVDLKSEDPAPTTVLVRAEQPDLTNGPHFFYGLQWWFFGVLAVFGFFYLMYDEKVNGRRGAEHRDDGAEVTPKKVRRSNHPYVRARQEAEARAAAAAAADQRARVIPPSTGSIAPEMNDAAGESRKAAARPNSSGSP